MKTLPVIVVLTGIAGCAAAPVEMRYYPEGEPPPLVWPEPPETARLAYAGELVGEANFGPVAGEEDGAALRVLKWIAGIAGGRERVDQLVRPQSGMVDDSGRILVTDAGREAVLVFDEMAGKLTVWDEAEPGRSFSSPVGIVADSADGYLVADADLGCLVRLDASGRPIGIIGDTVLERPTGMARDPVSGEIFVADSAAHDIKVFDAADRLVRTLGRRGIAAGEFNGPTHLSFSDGRLYVTDTLNARVQVLSGDGDPVAEVGQRGLYIGNLVRPKGIVADRDGHIYVIESYYDHVLVFNAAGELLLPIGGTGNGAGQFFLPAGAWSDAGERLFIADMFNGRVVVFDYLGDSS